LKADLLLLLTAAIWGFAFVAQRMGMDHMGPFTFNALRFSLGALVLFPLYIRARKRDQKPSNFQLKQNLLPIMLTGLALFGGASLQQIGLVGTSAGKAGFITGLYVILVPLLALFWKDRIHPAHWVGAILAAAGLYLLSVRGDFNVSPYDLIVLAGAFVWAGHVHLIAKYSNSIGPIRLSIFQFVICGLLSGFTAIMFEPISLDGILDGIWPVLYGGFLSVGLAFTLQVVAQRTANPSHAVIILSLEGAFAALGGWWVLQETLNARDLVGSGLMLAGTLVSQFLGRPHEKDAQEKF